MACALIFFSSIVFSQDEMVLENDEKSINRIYVDVDDNDQITGAKAISEDGKTGTNAIKTENGMIINQGEINEKGDFEKKSRTNFNFDKGTVEYLPCTNVKTSDGDCLHHDGGNFDLKDISK